MTLPLQGGDQGGGCKFTIAGALVASKLHITEAGLRSYNRRMPEEINRVLVDHISDLLFCPTKTSVENLKKEVITFSVYMVGDVLYDSLFFNLKLAVERSDILKKLSLLYEDNQVLPYCLVTVHRAENTNNPRCLQNILKTLEELNAIVVFPVLEYTIITWYCKVYLINYLYPNCEFFTDIPLFVNEDINFN